MNYTTSLLQDDPELHQDVARRTVNVLLSGEVQRFHATPSVDSQTVAHHSFGVAAILVGFGCMLDPDDRWLMSEAILHDAPEYFTGDIPFTVKRERTDVRAAVEQMELRACMDHLFVNSRLTPRQHVLLKLADMLEGLRWCLSGHERGSMIASRWNTAVWEHLMHNAGLLARHEVERVWAVYRRIASNHFESLDRFSDQLKLVDPLLHHNLYGRYEQEPQQTIEYTA